MFILIKENKETILRELTYKEALREALKEEMERDKNVFLIGEDIAEFGGTYKVTEDLYKEFGKERVRNTPISESAIIGAAVGASISGMRPVAEIMYIDFTAVAMDQICNQAAKIRYMTGGQVKVPLVIRTQGGGGRSSAAQHAQSLEAWFCHVPGLKVVMPSTPYDAKGLLKCSIRDDSPVIFIEHKMLYNQKGAVPEGEYLLPLGKADLKREGKDFTIIATSRMVEKALLAANELDKKGIDVEIIDPRTLVPLDKEAILSSVKKTGRVLIVHEACERCGFGAEIAAILAKEVFDYLDAPIERLGAKNVPMPFNPKLEEFVIPKVDEIVEIVKKVVG